MNSLKRYSHKFWLFIHLNFIYNGENMTYMHLEKDKYQDGFSFFFTVSLVTSIVCFAYSRVNKFVVNKLSYKLSLTTISSLIAIFILPIIFIKNKSGCPVI